MFRQLNTALRVTLFFTVLTGLCYPALITVVARAFFPKQAAGSLIEMDGRVVGSALIGQRFTKPGYFRGRPSAAGDGYDAANSGGSNLGPTSAKLAARVRSDVETFRRENPTATAPLPSDLVTASASGLDPHISPASAHLQAARVAAARGISSGRVHALVDSLVEGRQYGFLGEPRVNVLELNLALDRQFPRPR